VKFIKNFSSLSLGVGCRLKFSQKLDLIQKVYERNNQDAGQKERENQQT